MTALSLVGRRSAGTVAPLALTRFFSLRNVSSVSSTGKNLAAANNSQHARKKSISTLFNAFRPERVLVTGALGQVGRELVSALQSAYGTDNVVPTDVRAPEGLMLAKDNANFRRLDVLDPNQLQKLCNDEGITTVVHLAAILSATGEKDPLLALKINNEGIQNVLEVCRQYNLKVFSPSTIAVFGPDSPKEGAPEDCTMHPTTMYGITKVHAELLGEYYRRVHGVDFRSLRYPGVVSTKQKPGGGTTDWAVDIFHQAIQRGSYTCYLEKGTTLPFIYMPDLLQGTLQLLQADPSSLSRRVYNLGSMSFSPKQLASSIQRTLPDFTIRYMPDFRQDIADTWPKSIDYTAASNDWGWKPSYDLDNMTRDILDQFLQPEQCRKEKETKEREEEEGLDLEMERSLGGGSSFLSPV